MVNGEVKGKIPLPKQVLKLRERSFFLCLKSTRKGFRHRDQSYVLPSGKDSGRFSPKG